MKSNLGKAFQNIEWRAVFGVVALLIVATGLVALVLQKQSAGETEFVLGADEKLAYLEAQELASVYGNYDAAVTRLDMELARISSGDRNANNLYAEAKLSIYKADLLLTYALAYAEGFTLLGEVYQSEEYSDRARGEALALAMAHSLQALNEGALTLEEVRDYVFLNPLLQNVFDMGIADALLLDETLEVYPYLARGFAVAKSLAVSEETSVLIDSYSLRISSPFVIAPPTGGYYQAFIDSAAALESRLDGMAAEITAQNLPYQEFVASSYYNLAHAYEMLPPGDADIVENMSRVHGKLAAYLSAYADTSYGAHAYLTGISTRIICKAVDTADFDSSLVNTGQIQPYLDEIYGSEGWVVPCAEAFLLIAEDIDSRFAEYF